MLGSGRSGRCLKGHFLVEVVIWRFPCYEEFKNIEAGNVVQGIMNARKKKVLITAGPTREWLDPVRFISNPSSGRMGYAVAEAAVDAGFEVDLVSGPVSLKVPEGLSVHKVNTALEMFSVVEDLFSHCDCFISVAAVSDWRPAEVHEQKVKKGEDRQVVEFVANPDILRTMASRKSESQVIVGFCAETENLEENARTKLESKNLDWIAGNWVGKESRGRGFESVENQLLLLGKNGAKEILGPGLKSGLAVQLISRVLS